MSADRIVYCLERVSDYRDFERLCSALLAGSDYCGIDPLGGTGDEGRDAIIRTDVAGRRIVFAYTVRGDWLTKLKTDCNRVQERAHNPNVFVFVCTEALTAAEKDRAHELVSTKYGWALDLYDLERLRVQLAGPQRHLIAQHPSIFTPPFFPQSGGQSLAESRDTLLIDHVDADHALATWLSRRLTLAGYRTWCRGTAPMAGENPDDSVRKLIELRGCQYLPLLSEASLSDALFLERCGLSAARESFVLPCSCAPVQESRLPSRMRSVAAANFAASWNEGIAQVLARLAALGIRPSLEGDLGKEIALRDYLPSRVTVYKPEPVFANMFALHLPAAMLIHDLSRALKDDEVEALRTRWAFAELSPYRLVSFSPHPPGCLPLRSHNQHIEFSWADVPQRDGRRTEDLAKELASRSLELVCQQKGLRYCPDRKVFYFPERDDGEWSQPFRHVDGRTTRVQLTGERTRTRGDDVQTSLYQLAPKFRPQCESGGDWYVVLNIYIRVTDANGKPYELKDIARRRKAVTKSWWNNHFLARMLGVIQALETREGRIEVGEGKRQVVVDTAPLSWQCPVGLDVAALSGQADLGEELAAYRTREDEETDDAEMKTVATEGPAV